MVFEKQIRRFLGDQLFDCFLWFLYTVLGALLPLWIGMFLFNVLGKWKGMDLFISHGELCIYSAALLTPSMYVMQRYSKTGYMMRYLLYVSYLSVLVAALCYSLILASDLLKEGIAFNHAFVIGLSIGLFVYAVLVSVGIKVWENIKGPQDWLVLRKQKFIDLENRFNKL